MSDSFVPGLRMLWLLSARMLGWRPNDFWNATPEELVSVLADPTSSLAEPLTRDAILAMMERENNG